MPRNAAGVYSLPDPPRVPNTVIDSPDENITRDDIGAELTNSLDRNGRGGMLAPFRIADGTLAAPGLAFLNEPGTGIWRQGPGDMRMGVQGAEMLRFTPGVITVQAGVQLQVASSFFMGGNIALQGWMSKTGTNQGLSFDATDNANFTKALSVNGVLALGAGLLDVGVGLPLDKRIFPSTPDGADNVRLFIQGGGGLNTVAQGAFIGVYGNESVSNGSIDIVAGDVGGGQIAFYTGTGNLQLTIPRVVGANRSFILSGSAGANPTINVTGGLVQFGVGIIVPTGQGIYLDGGFDTLIFENGADSIRMTTGGVPRFDVFGPGNQSKFFQSVSIPAGQDFFFDGGGDTFIREFAPNVLHIFVGGNAALRLFAAGAGIARFNSGLSVPPGQGVYFDGGADTVILESAPDEISINTGGAERVKIRNTFVNFNVGIAVPSGSGLYLDGGSDTFITEVAANTVAFIVGAVERARATPLGFFKFSDSGAYANVNGNYHEMRNTNNNAYACVFTNTTAAPTGLLIQYTNADPNNNVPTQFFVDCLGMATRRIAMMSNGGLANFQSNDQNLSDATVKNHWEPYSSAQLEAFSAAVDAMEFGRYKYRDQTHDDWNHGYVAQNVREAFSNAAPELVDYWDDSKKDLLAVYSTDLVNINLAVARHEIRKLKAEVAALKARMN